MSEPIVIAFIGVAGAVIGAIAAVIAGIANSVLERRVAEKRDEPRKNLLLQMLKNPEYNWRELDTLSHVIGADEETTKRLLLRIGARASENGKPLWGLISRNPLP